MNTTQTPTVHFKRGDIAVTDGLGGGTRERVRIIRAEWITVGIGATERRERWLHIEFTDGGRVMTHPSRLVPMDASW